MYVFVCVYMCAMCICVCVNVYMCVSVCMHVPPAAVRGHSAAVTGTARPHGVHEGCIPSAGGSYAPTARHGSTYTAS